MCLLIYLGLALLTQIGDIRGVHDPALIEVDGRFHLFSTGRGLPVRISDDLFHWRLVGRVFPDGPPAWHAEQVPGTRFPWAPDISSFGGEFRLYYSVSTFGSNRSAIGLATNRTLDPTRPDYRWVDRGPVIDSLPGRDRFNAIDPNIVLDERGVPWMAFGSFFAGIQMVRLDPATGLRAVGHPEIHHLASRGGENAVEAPHIIRRGPFYYLFLSFDHCCRGAQSDYYTVVGRADQVTGPYLDRQGVPLTRGGGTTILRGNGPIRGPGHPAVLTRPDGDFLVHHFYDADARGLATLQIRPLLWTIDHWPEVGEPLGHNRYPPPATQPSQPATPSPSP